MSTIFLNLCSTVWKNGNYYVIVYKSTQYGGIDLHNQEKIVIMAKLAVYDKNTGKDDWKDNVFFRQDYIYANNMRTRFFAFFGCLILTVFYILHIAAFQDTDIFSINIQAQAIRIIIFFALVLVAYTVIGTILYTAMYAQTQKRIENYFKLLDRLDEINEQEELKEHKTEVAHE